MNSYGRPFICTESKCRFLTKMMQMKLGHNCVSFVILRREGLTPSQLRRAERKKEERNQRRLAAEEPMRAATKAGDDIDVVVKELKCNHCDVIIDSEKN